MGPAEHITPLPHETRHPQTDSGEIKPVAAQTGVGTDHGSLAGSLSRALPDIPFLPPLTPPSVRSVGTGGKNVSSFRDIISNLVREYPDALMLMRATYPSWPGTAIEVRSTSRIGAKASVSREGVLVFPIPDRGASKNRTAQVFIDAFGVSSVSTLSMMPECRALFDGVNRIVRARLVLHDDTEKMAAELHSGVEDVREALKKMAYGGRAARTFYDHLTERVLQCWPLLQVAAPPPALATYQAQIKDGKPDVLITPIITALIAWRPYPFARQVDATFGGPISNVLANLLTSRPIDRATMLETSHRLIDSLKDVAVLRTMKRGGAEFDSTLRHGMLCAVSEKLPLIATRPAYLAMQRGDFNEALAISDDGVELCRSIMDIPLFRSSNHSAEVAALIPEDGGIGELWRNALQIVAHSCASLRDAVALYVSAGRQDLSFEGFAHAILDLTGDVITFAGTAEAELPAQLPERVREACNLLVALGSHNQPAERRDAALNELRQRFEASILTVEEAGELGPGVIYPEICMIMTRYGNSTEFIRAIVFAAAFPTIITTLKSVAAAMIAMQMNPPVERRLCAQESAARMAVAEHALEVLGDPRLAGVEPEVDVAIVRKTLRDNQRYADLELQIADLGIVEAIAELASFTATMQSQPSNATPEECRRLDVIARRVIAPELDPVLCEVAQRISAADLEGAQSSFGDLEILDELYGELPCMRRVLSAARDATHATLCAAQYEISRELIRSALAKGTMVPAAQADELLALVEGTPSLKGSEGVQRDLAELSELYRANILRPVDDAIVLAVARGDSEQAARGLRELRALIVSFPHPQSASQSAGAAITSPIGSVHPLWIEACSSFAAQQGATRAQQVLACAVTLPPFLEGDEQKIAAYIRNLEQRRRVVSMVLEDCLVMSNSTPVDVVADFDRRCLESTMKLVHRRQLQTGDGGLIDSPRRLRLLQDRAARLLEIDREAATCSKGPIGVAVVSAIRDWRAGVVDALVTEGIAALDVAIGEANRSVSREIFTFIAAFADRERCRTKFPYAHFAGQVAELVVADEARKRLSGGAGLPLAESISEFLHFTSLPCGEENGLFRSKLERGVTSTAEPYQTALLLRAKKEALAELDLQRGVWIAEGASATPSSNVLSHPRLLVASKVLKAYEGFARRLAQHPDCTADELRHLAEVGASASFGVGPTAALEALRAMDSEPTIALALASRKALQDTSHWSQLHPQLKEAAQRTFENWCTEVATVPPSMLQAASSSILAPMPRNQDSSSSLQMSEGVRHHLGGIVEALLKQSAIAVMLQEVASSIDAKSTCPDEIARAIAPAREILERHSHLVPNALSFDFSQQEGNLREIGLQLDEDDKARLADEFSQWLSERDLMYRFIVSHLAQVPGVQASIAMAYQRWATIALNAIDRGIEISESVGERVIEIVGG